MKRARATRWAIAVAGLSLLGSLSALVTLWRGAQRSLERVVDARLRGAGESAAILLAQHDPSEASLSALMKAQGLDAAYLLDRNLVVLADATGPAGGHASLLRVDPERVAAAFAGTTTVEVAYSLGQVSVATGYFPVRGKDQVERVLALEAGRAFADLGPWISRALLVGVLGAALAAAAIGIAGRRSLRTEASAARADAFARLAAMAAHEIRNPLGVIRGTVELMRDRLSGSLTARDSEALLDVLGEVERLRRLTDDLVDLGSDRPLALADVDVGAVLEETARSIQAAHPAVAIRVDVQRPLPPVIADANRLRQVFGNLLANAAHAQEQGEVRARAWAENGSVMAQVRDHGPGVPAEARDRLFDPFFTTKAQGAGLGLYISRRLVERHGGSLRYLDQGGSGATFEVRLQARRDDGAGAGRG